VIGSHHQFLLVKKKAYHQIKPMVLRAIKHRTMYEAW
jgi:hypothetical protein